jgi:hypothetical protein
MEPLKRLVRPRVAAAFKLANLDIDVSALYLIAAPRQL